MLSSVPEWRVVVVHDVCMIWFTCLYVEATYLHDFQVVVHVEPTCRVYMFSLHASLMAVQITWLLVPGTCVDYKCT